jgi:LysR family transcriptional activator of glutamate synthase operon
MEIRQLRYFCEVAKREHVSEAAQFLHIAQSAISRQIANLETELRVQLFIKEGRNVKLTPAGKLFLEHAESALKAIDHAKSQIDEYLDPERGTIKIGFPTSLASHFLPTVISEFKEKYKHIKFHLRQGSYKFLIDALKNMEIDIAFIGPVPKDDSDISGYVLFSESICALLPVNHPLASRQKLHLTDLQDEEFILFPEGMILHQIVIDACTQAGFTPRTSTIGEDLDAIKGLISAGMGVTLLPESTIYDATPPRTVKIPIINPRLKRSVGLIVPKKRDLAPSEKVFFDFVKEFFSHVQEYK